MKLSEHAASKGAAISNVNKNKAHKNKKQVLRLQIMIVAILDIVIALVVYLLAKLVCIGVADAVFDSYMRVLFIPLISFLTAFASFVFTKKILSPVK